MSIENFKCEFFFIINNELFYKKNIKPIMFSNKNISHVIDKTKIKYKFIFDEIKLSNDIQYILPKITYIKNNNKYCAYSFFPIIKNKNIKHTCYGRSIDVKFHNNKIISCWIYMTKDYIQEIIDSKNYISDEDYIKEFINL